MASPAYPGTPLRSGTSGSPVGRVQTYLNQLSSLKYPSITKLTVDGQYGSMTSKSVTQYQALKGLSADGVVGQNTWNTLIEENSAITGSSADTYPGISLQNGSKSQDVTHMQTLLTANAALYTAINKLTADGSFGSNTQAAAKRFQPQFSLSTDGVIGRNTWNKIVDVKNALGTAPMKVTTAYGGTPLQKGSSGDSVRFAQSYLNKTGAALTIDGQFGSATQSATIKFQTSKGLKADGIIGSATWSALVAAFNAAI